MSDRALLASAVLRHSHEAKQASWQRSLAAALESRLPTLSRPAAPSGRAGRREFEQADAGWTSVAGVASSWGFVNGDRFVDDFENRYPEPPWLTLRGPAYA